MSEIKLTKKQHEFLECFKSLSEANRHFSPSLREIQKALGYKSVSTAAVHADALVRMGILQKEDNSARSLRIVDPEARAEPSENEKHLEWLRNEIDKRKEYPEQAKKLRAALEVLDQTED